MQGIALNENNIPVKYNEEQKKFETKVIVVPNNNYYVDDAGQIRRKKVSK